MTNKIIDDLKTKEQLLQELSELRKRNSELEKLDSEYKRILEELRQIHGELAIRVKVRTAEVTKANEDLQKEIFERKRTQEILLHRFEFEKIISGISTNFVNISPQEVDNEIKHALRIVGEFISADVSLLFSFSENLKRADNTHQWFAEGVDLDLQDLKTVDTEDFSWWMSKLSKFDYICIPDVNNLPAEAESAKSILQKNSVRSLIVVPMPYVGRLVGALGFISLQPEKIWDEEYFALLKIVGEVLANALQRKVAEEELKSYQEHLQMLVRERTEQLSISNEQLHVEIAVHREIEDALRESEEKYRLLFDIVPVGIGVADAEGKIYAANNSMQEMIGLSLDELKTANLSDTYVDKNERQKLIKALLENGIIRDWVVRLKRKDGTIYLAQLNIVQIELAGKKLFLTAQRDITEKKRLEDELAQYHKHLETLIKERTAQLELLNKQLQQDISERSRTEERIIKINACFLGLGEEPFENINRLISLCGELLGPVCVLYNRLEKGKLYSWGKWNAPQGLKSGVEPSGHICYDVIRNSVGKVVVINNLPETAYARTDPAVLEYNLKTYIGKAVSLDGAYVGSLCAVYQHDFIPTEEDKIFFEIIAAAIGVEERRKKTQGALKKSEQEKAIILDSAQDLIVYHDTDMRILWANKAAGDSVNVGQELLKGRFCWEIWHNRKTSCRDCPVVETIKTGKSHKAEIKSPDGRIWFIRGYPVFDEQGKIEGVVELCSDISERKEAEKKLEDLNKELLKSNKKLKQLALRDPQTGLFNHRYLEEVIEAEFYRARRYAHSLSLIMLDVDYFKSINDVYGYQFGDLVLKQLTQQLKLMLRRYDIIIRFSGEEFVILSPGTERSQALVLAQRLLDALSLYSFGNKEHRVKLKLSIAVVTYPDDKIVKGSHLVELAEQMIGRIKEDGGNRVYSSSDLNKKKHLRTDNHESGPEVDLLKNKIDKLNKEANQNLIEAIFAFAKTIEVKDRYTGEHVESTVHYATEIAKALGLSKDETEHIKQAAMLHDLGKIGISEKILLKETKLSKKEFDIIKKHPQIGVDIIRPIKFLHSIISLIFYHHERWDGKGYPSGLRGEDIPIGARIIAIADVYQALISDRPYRKALSKAEAVKTIKNGAGTQFDPHIVRVFLKILKKEK